jgi:hypothetical protein
MNRNSHLVHLRAHLFEMSCLRELELSQELRHPLHIVLAIMRNTQVDSFNDTLGIVLEVLAAIYPLVAALGSVSGADRAE